MVWPAADSGAAAVEPAAEAEASTGRSAEPTEDKCAADNHAAVPWDGGGTVWAHGAAAVATGGGTELAAGAAPIHEVVGTWWAHGASACASGGGAELAAGAAASTSVLSPATGGGTALPAAACEASNHRFAGISCSNHRFACHGDAASAFVCRGGLRVRAAEPAPTWSATGHVSPDGPPPVWGRARRTRIRV